MANLTARQLTRIANVVLRNQELTQLFLTGELLVIQGGGNSHSSRITDGRLGMKPSGHLKRGHLCATAAARVRLRTCHVLARRHTGLRLLPDCAPYRLETT